MHIFQFDTTMLKLKKNKIKKLRNPACSFRSRSSRASFILSRMILCSILLAHGRSLQFLQRVKSPFLGSFTRWPIASSSETVLRNPDVVKDSGGPWPKPVLLPFQASRWMLSHPGTFSFFIFIKAFLTSAIVIGPVRIASAGPSVK